MFLKRVEIFGFKSFPNKTVFKFDPGTTCIVGPNGCGKSNVSDAIKWVIGEQKVKALRGSSMQDVIFSGSSDIKPLSMAEVTLVLDNSTQVLGTEFSEVMITRRLYRSGESEYLLNKKSCRLKDITDLLMDTGLGADSYSVIEQGRMDRVLQAKPEERRFVFEEAAGITKYKARRKEALRKLDRTTENLLRATDIMTEVKRQIGSIERQASKARRFKNYKDELVHLEVVYSRKHATEIEELCSKSREALNACSSDEQNLLTQTSSIEGEIEKVQLEVVAKEEELAQQNKLYAEAETHFKLAEKQVDFNKEKIEELKSQNQKRSLEIEQSEKHIADLNGQNQSDEQSLLGMQKELQDKQDALSAWQQSLNELSGQFQTVQAEERSLKDEQVAVSTEMSKNKNTIQMLQQRLEQAQGRVSTIEQEQKAKTEQKLEIEQSISQKHEQLKSYEQLLSGLQGKRQELLQTQQSLEKDLEELTERISEKRSALSSKKSHLNVLERMRKNYEGYAGGTKKTLQKRDAGALYYKDIETDLANVLTVDSRYQLAVESALGSAV